MQNLANVLTDNRLLQFSVLMLLFAIGIYLGIAIGSRIWP